MPGHKLLSINDSSISLECISDKKTVTVDADYVVLSLGVRPDTSLYDEIKNSNDYKVYNIGDSDKIGRIANATEAAFQLVSSIE